MVDDVERISSGIIAMIWQKWLDNCDTRIIACALCVYERYFQ